MPTLILFGFVPIMKTNFLSIFAASWMTGSLALLSPAALAIQPIATPEIRAAAQSAATPRDHELVAKHYDKVPVQAQAKVKEQKELLKQYQNKSYLYGRQAQDLQSHTEALIRDYEQKVTATLREAAMHRQMASRLQEKHASSDTQRGNVVKGATAPRPSCSTGALVLRDWFLQFCSSIDILANLRYSGESRADPLKLIRVPMQSLKYDSTPVIVRSKVLCMNFPELRVAHRQPNGRHIFWRPCLLTYGATRRPCLLEDPHGYRPPAGQHFCTGPSLPA